MPVDERLAERVRHALAGEDGIEERRMMGGLVFLRHGHMVGGVDRDRLLVRVGPEGYDEALGQPHVGPMDIGGRTPRGFVLVEAAGVEAPADLRRWLSVGVAYAATLPPKPRR